MNERWHCEGKSTPCKSCAAWLERIAAGHAEDGTPARRKGESWPMIKPKVIKR